MLVVAIFCSKYTIDFVLRSVFIFEDARQVLKDTKFDYGIRHYGEPFTTDPLGPSDREGGALWHGKVKAQQAKGGGHG